MTDEGSYVVGSMGNPDLRGFNTETKRAIVAMVRALDANALFDADALLASPNAEAMQVLLQAVDCDALPDAIADALERHLFPDEKAEKDDIERRQLEFDCLDETKKINAAKLKRQAEKAKERGEKIQRRDHVAEAERMAVEDYGWSTVEQVRKRRTRLRAKQRKQI
jgi:hypothetical protein